MKNRLSLFFSGKKASRHCRRADRRRFSLFRPPSERASVFSPFGGRLCTTRAPPSIPPPCTSPTGERKPCRHAGESPDSGGSPYGLRQDRGRARIPAQAPSAGAAGFRFRREGRSLLAGMLPGAGPRLFRPAWGGATQRRSLPERLHGLWRGNSALSPCNGSPRSAPPASTP